MGSLNGAALRAIRRLQEPSLTQEILAERTGISQPFLSRLESGSQQPTPDVIRALATQLGVPIAAITNPHEACPRCAELAIAS